MVFMGCGFTSGGQESVFSAAVCKIQESKHYIESLPSVPKDKQASSLKVKGPLYSCLLITHLPSRSRTLNWHLETIYRPFLQAWEQESIGVSLLSTHISLVPSPPSQRFCVNIILRPTNVKVWEQGWFPSYSPTYMYTHTVDREIFV